MNRIVILILSLLICFELSAQVITGCVVDEDNQPIDNVSVILLGNRKPLAFGRTDFKGRFLIEKGEKNGDSLLFSMLGYAKDTIDVRNFRQGQTVVLREQAYNLKDVVIKAPKIIQEGDTLNYLVNAFKQEQDKSIADVIAKMPGLQVNNDGTIEYQGRRINKFYIEGMDLLGSKYAQISENLSADKVKTVQVYENHQNIKMLRGLSFSEQAALNIVLSDDAKNVWQGVIDLGAGTVLQDKAKFLCDSRLMAMLFTRKMQSFSMFKFNNTGADLRDGVALRKFFEKVPEESGVVQNVSINVPDLNENRTRFNTTHLLATNWLFKTYKGNDVRLQLNGVFDKNELSQKSVTQYANIETDNIIDESFSTRSYSNSISGDLSYHANSDNLYLTNNIRANLFFDHSDGVSIANGVKQRQYVKPHKRSFSDEFNIANKLDNGKHIKSSAYFSYNYLPSILLTANQKQQELNLETFYWGVSSGFSHSLGPVYTQYSISDSGFSQSVEEAGSGIDRTYTRNMVEAAVTVYDNTQLFSWNVKLPISLLTQSFYGKGSADIIFEPQAMVTFRPDSHWNMSAFYTFSKSAMDGVEICPLPIYTSYITRSKGSGDFDFREMHTVRLNTAYKHVMHGLFASLQLGYSCRPNEIMYENILDGIIYQSAATEIRSKRESYNASMRFNKTFGFGFSAGVTAYFSLTKYNYLINHALVPSELRNINLSIDLSYKPCKWFMIEEKSYMFNYRMNRKAISDNAGYSKTTNTFNHEINLYLTFPKWVVQWSNELYHSSDNSASFNFFSDISVTHKFKDGEISLTINNMAGNSIYEREIISAQTVTVTRNRIRPREVLVKYTFYL